MPIGHYLSDKLRIAKLPPSQWLSELQKLSPEASAEVEAFLREQSQLLRIRRQSASRSDSSTSKSLNTRKR